MNEDFQKGFKHAQELADWILQWHREQGETDIRGIKSAIKGLLPELTVEFLKEEYGEEL